LNPEHQVFAANTAREEWILADGQKDTGMTKATFDLFDAPLGEAFEYCQRQPDEVRFAMYRREFSVDPQNWRRHGPPTWAFGLRWQEFRYADVQSAGDLDRLIGKDHPGVYVFYARPKKLIYQFPQFAFYIGISNEHGSKRPLRERLKDYLPTALAKIRKRKNIHRMLQFYYESLWVAFALTDEHATDLESLEKALHGYIHPCFARRDFPPEVKTQQKAFGVT